MFETCQSLNNIYIYNIIYITYIINNIYIYIYIYILYIKLNEIYLLELVHTLQPL